MFDPRSERLDAIFQQAPELREYERWLAAAPRATPEQPRDYLFTDDQVRFEPRKDDVVVLQSGLTLVQDPQGVALRSEHSAARIRLVGVDRSAAEKIARAIDGARCLLEVRLDSGVAGEALARFLRATFGLVLFCPQSVAALEQVMPGAEIVRFPSSPYAVERPYWENMIGVRDWFATHADEAVRSSEDFLRSLRRMHVIALMGARLDSFYKPRSPVSDRIVAPGAFYLDEPRILTTAQGPLYFDGPRVNVSLIGGPRYHRALYESANDAAAFDDARVFEVDGLPWGRFLSARSERDAEPRPWFFPPRPLREEHLEVLRRELGRALRAAHEFERMAGSPAQHEALQALARFHQAFLRLHPFHCANQSLAMALVNAVLRRTHGGGIPHLILDHLALRLSDEAYAVVFARAVDGWVEREPSPVKRLELLSHRKQRFLHFVERSARCTSAREFETIRAADPDATRWALVSDRSA